jgi:hypothetical protein
MMTAMLLTSVLAQGQTPLALSNAKTQTVSAAYGFMHTTLPTSLLTVSNSKDAAERRPFQARVIVSPTANGFQTEFLPIPAGKRLVIENVSAIARSPEGFSMEINFFTYYDNNGDGVGDVADITFHRIALTEQGTFSGIAISSANHKVLVFADEMIGTTHFQVGVGARLDGVSTVAGQAQVTFSGYVEDLPKVP